MSHIVKAYKINGKGPTFVGLFDEETGEHIPLVGNRSPKNMVDISKIEIPKLEPKCFLGRMLQNLKKIY